MARFVPWLASTLALIWLAASPFYSLLADESFTDSKFGFSLVVPNGFKPQAVPSKMPDILYAFIREKAAHDPFEMMLVVEKLKGVIPQQALRQQDLPASSIGKLFTMPWSGLNLDAFAVPEGYKNNKALTINVQIPLKRGGIQLKIVGPAEKEEELKRLLSEILSSLKGESNWSTTPNLESSEPRNNDDVANAAVFIGVVFLITMAVFYSISRTQPRFVVLVAGLFFSLGLLIPTNSNNRAMLIVCGILRLAGFCGLIMGIVQSFSLERRKKKLAAQQSEIIPLEPVHGK